MPDEYESYLPGIQYAESRGQAEPYSAVGDQGRSLGAFQIQPIMYRDIQRLVPQPWSTIRYEEMIADPMLQRQAAHDGLQMLNQHYGLSGDALLSAWNTGPTKARKGIMNKAYIKTVHEGMRKGNRALKQFK